ncbi:prolipoprotein diacylglyceryl transferase family protein [Pectobacterium actinidiae]|uniref:prolipoprotein diacylglyceryl transferase family protein n=1 Tax=Pectobacterium actinidiae TaxID=1507808 RepID=UPI003808DFAC
MISLGPFSIRIVIVAVAAFVAWLVARLLARNLPDGHHKTAGGLILDALFVGLVAARLGYITSWWSEYSSAPLSMLAIGDGGFNWWLGMLAAFVFLLWRTRSMPALRRPAFAGVASGLLAWTLAGGALTLLQRSAPPLPDLQLTTLDARSVSLSSYAGRPTVVNLWATWCPPCRREMPAFQQAQETFPGVAFVLVNQGESSQVIRTFLQREGLVLEHVLLDPPSRAMQALGARGLPTTLFFDAQGRLVDSHMGELTTARMKDTLLRRFGPEAALQTDRE